MAIATNKKTGTQGWVRSTYNRISDSVAMVEVTTFDGHKAHWRAAHVEIKG